MSLQVEVLDRVMRLTVDRPDARNAIDGELATLLEGALDQASGAEDVHAVVLSARGEVFLSGGDLRELSLLPADPSGAARVAEIGERIAAIERCAVPVIAAIQGDVFGGGAELVCMCDLVIMTETASLRFVHRNMGLVPAWGGATRLLERVGAGAAADLMLTARPLGAEEARTLGLVSRVAPAGGALEMALAIAREMAATPRAALCAIKRSHLEVKRARRGSALEKEQAVFASAWGSPAHREAMQRVRQKR